MALRGLMQSDAERAMPIIEKMLAGTNSPKVKDRALFVLSQTGTHTSARDHRQRRQGRLESRPAAARDQYLGIMGGSDNRQILAERLPRIVRRGGEAGDHPRFMVSGDRARIC